MSTRTYRKIYILFADEEPAEAYADESLAQTVMARCEDWQRKLGETETAQSIGAITPAVFRDKMATLVSAHPISSTLANAEDYALKTVLLCERNSDGKVKTTLLQKELDDLTEWAHDGCGDGNCRIKKPSGMRTNGGCRCTPKRFAKSLLDLAEQLEAMGSQFPDQEKPTL